MKNYLFGLIARFLASNPRITDRLLERAKRTPYMHLDGYMNRWWLFNPYDQATRQARYEWIPFSIRFHHILREDLGRHPHDHPWNARTLILRGWYMEKREGEAVRMRHAGDTARLNFGEFHHIEAVSPGGVLTLFITYKYGGTWGFLVNGKKVEWREYLDVPESE